MIFAYLTLLAALALASVAGWFSIIGIMSIYAGAALHALIMGIVLECGKLVTTSWVYRNWDYAPLRLKIPLIIFTILLMLTTSMGVFGFLSKAHLDQGASTIDNSGKVDRLNQQIAREQAVITDDEKVINQLDATINSYIGKDRTDKSLAVRRRQAPQRQQLKGEIDASQNRISDYSDQKLKLQSEVRKAQLDVGPIRYIAEMIYGADNNTDKNIESAVRIFTLTIVSTLDPLAVILLMAANHTLLRIQSKNDNNTESVNETQEEHSIENEEVAEHKGGPVSVHHEEIPDPVSAAMDTFSQNDIHGYSIDEERGQQLATTEDEITQVPEEIINETQEEHISKDESTVEQTHAIGDQSHLLETGTPGVEFLDITCTEENTTGGEGNNGAEDTTQDVQTSAVTLDDLTFPDVSPLPVIRQPNSSRVSMLPGLNLDIPFPEESKQAPKKVQWADQNPVLREIFGSTPHFTPRKVNEDEKSKTTSAPASTSSTDDTTLPPEVPEVYTEPSGENIKADGISENTTALPGGGIYPKALSWLNEFRRS